MLGRTTGNRESGIGIRGSCAAFRQTTAEPGQHLPDPSACHQDVRELLPRRETELDTDLEMGFELAEGPVGDIQEANILGTPTSTVPLRDVRSEEHTSELQSRGLISYA